MNKQTAIILCKLFCKVLGIYAMPAFDPSYKDWTIRINHPLGTITEPEGLRFIDCQYNPHDRGLNDFPIYYRPERTQP